MLTDVCAHGRMTHRVSARTSCNLLPMMTNVLDFRVCFVLSLAFPLVCYLFCGVSDVFQRYFDLMSKADIDIVIGILSARDHFNQRQTLRETWVGGVQNDTNLGQKILIKFLVGQEACSIPPDYRADPYACNELNITTQDEVRDLSAMQVMPCIDSSGYQEQRFIDDAIGFDFKVNHAIVIDRLGVYNMGDMKQPIKITLYDTWRKEPIAISHFSKEQAAIIYDGFRYRPVEPYILPKDFEGTLVVEGLSHNDNGSDQCMHHDDRDGGLITVKQFFRSGAHGFPDDTRKLSALSQYPVGANFIYHVHDPESLLSWKRKRNEEQRKYVLKMKEESRRLEEELSVHDDILLLNVIDTYRNLPKKLLLFYHWIDENANFKYVIKTDDDCFLNINNILTAIRTKQLDEADKTWWGHFRTSWAVQHDGKWADLEYPCSGYPSFACGVASLLTADVVRWIARNYGHLHSYQGEDVSLGIWMSSILPRYDHDTRWIWDDVCEVDMYASAEHTSNELRTMWTNYIECGNPCNCTDSVT